MANTLIESRTTKVLLAGNPNSGKTSIFNALTGARQRVGNYPGVTVERRDGRYHDNGRSFVVTDLPGTYSLTSFSPEERITQDELINANGSVVVTVVDSTTLKRSLVLLAQILRTGANPVLCLNMADEAQSSGQQLDLHRLEELLGFPVVETIGHRGRGVEQLKDAIQRAADKPLRRPGVRLGDRVEAAIAHIQDVLPAAEFPEKIRGWVASKLLIGEPGLTQRVRAQGRAGEEAIDVASSERERLEAETGMDAALHLTERYYGFVDGLLREVTTRSPREDAREVSDSVDRVLANRVIGVPIFLAIMYAVFWVTFTVGEYPMTWIETGFSALGSAISGLWPLGSESPIRSLLVDGIIGGVGGVIVFLPNIVLLFVGLALLEDTGYMARAAFLADRLMHRVGLHGRSFIPLMTGFGCSIPGIMATRTLENERDRLATMLVLPLMSCGARLAIWMLLIPAFFAPHWRAPILWLIYLTGIVLALAFAMLLRRTLLKGDEAPFVMELPPYRVPTLRGVVRKALDRSWIYLRKAGTIILGISVLLWFVASYPKPPSYEINREIENGTVEAFRPAPDMTESVMMERLADARRDAPPGVQVLTAAEIERHRQSEDLRYSIAGRIGRAMEPVIRPMGFDWKLGTAMIGAFAAKEVFVAQIGIVYSLGETNERSQGLRSVISREYSPLVAISLILFLLVGTPCMATVAITRRESGSWKWALLQFGGLTALAYFLSLIVYQVGRLLA